jgi:hypothetical protein
MFSLKLEHNKESPVKNNDEGKVLNLSMRIKH